MTFFSAFVKQHVQVRGRSNAEIVGRAAENRVLRVLEQWIGKLIAAAKGWPNKA
jgi:hypothetical protein